MHQLTIFAPLVIVKTLILVISQPNIAGLHHQGPVPLVLVPLSLHSPWQQSHLC
jgi:hypothetical protein